MNVAESSGTCWMLDHVVQAMSRLWKILAFLECTYMNILFVSFSKNIGTPANPNACVPKIYCGPLAEGKSILYLLCFKRLAWNEFTKKKLCRRSMAYRRAITKGKGCFMHNYPTQELEFRGNFRLGVPWFWKPYNLPYSELRLPLMPRKAAQHHTLHKGHPVFHLFFFEQARNREQFLQPLTWRRGMRPQKSKPKKMLSESLFLTLSHLNLARDMRRQLPKLVRKHRSVLPELSQPRWTEQPKVVINRFLQPTCEKSVEVMIVERQKYDLGSLAVFVVPQKNASFSSSQTYKSES